MIKLKQNKSDNMKNQLSVLAGKISYQIIKQMGKSGTALPGKVALTLDKDILKKLSENCKKLIYITGTNGKTTTNNITNEIFKNKYDIISNLTGSNMIQGIITPLLLNSDEKYDWGIFEIDEGSLPIVSEQAFPDYLIVTNFFRDQLDRYGEVETTIKLVHDSIKEDTVLILNADDPSTLYFDDLNNKKIYYSQNYSNISKGDLNVAESIFCPKCGKRLDYEYINYGNIGKYKCPNCKTHNPKSNYTITNVELNDDNSYEFEVNNNFKVKLNLPGSYNLYNAIAAISVACEENINPNIIQNQIENFKYERGRMETFEINDKKVVLGLSKNPIGLSEVFRTLTFDLTEKSIMFILNDNPADGRDISWIWDADFEEVLNIPNIDYFYCCGKRAEEIAIRLKYEDFDINKIKICHSENENELENIIDKMLNNTINKDKYIIGTFTAMPEARKILVKKVGDE